MDFLQKKITLKRGLVCLGLVIWVRGCKGCGSRVKGVMNGGLRIELKLDQEALFIGRLFPR